MRKIITMRQALASPDYFARYLSGPTWEPWRVLLMAIMGETLTLEERAIYTRLTEREHEPREPVSEFTGVVGRRGGKSRAMGTLGAYLGACCDYRDVLAPGQRARLPIIAQAKKQADEVLSYVTEAIGHSPNLSPLIDGPVVDRTLRLKSRVDIEVNALNFRTLRGGTSIGVIADELAFWRTDESVTPDVEVIRALKPSLATTGGPLIKISSPYAKSGVLYTSFTRDFGPNGRPNRLVARGSTSILNPSISQAFLDDEKADDPVAFESEYMANFRTDISSFVPRDKVEAAVVQSGRTVVAPASGITYSAFIDPSGSGKDAMTLAIAHKGDEDKIILDALVIRKPPFSPAQVLKDFSAVLKEYRCSKIVGDHWGGEWVREPFRSEGIEYEKTALNRSAIYIDFLPLLLSGRVELLDDPQLIAELLALERKTAPGGKDTINHPRGGHDDAINAAAGALRLAAEGRSGFDSSYSWVTGDDDPAEAERNAALERQLQQEFYRYRGQIIAAHYGR